MHNQCMCRKYCMHARRGNSPFMSSLRTSVGSMSRQIHQTKKQNQTLFSPCFVKKAVREERNHSRIVSQPLSITCMQFFHLSSRAKEKRSFPYSFLMKKIIINMSWKVTPTTNDVGSKIFFWSKQYSAPLLLLCCKFFNFIWFVVILILGT